MDFRQLKYFTMVAEAKTFTRAAELLGLAQPALSTQMLKLCSSSCSSGIRAASNSPTPGGAC
jgi:hypothetical protein